MVKQLKCVLLRLYRSLLVLLRRLLFECVACLSDRLTIAIKVNLNENLLRQNHGHCTFEFCLFFPRLIAFSLILVCCAALHVIL